MEMLEGVAELTLDFLNEATQAWVEIEYNRKAHREISCSPVERFAQSPEVLRSSPSSNALRDAFRLETQRRQRPRNELPPLLKKILKEYFATGTPPAYLPKKPDPNKGED